MNTGIWLFLEVVFDTLMFAPYLLRGRFLARVKTQILLTYLRLSATLLLVHPFRPIKQDRVLGFTVHCFDYRTMHLLFRVILPRNEYYSETSKERPVIFDCGANIGPTTLATQGFGYQVDTVCRPLYALGRFQNLMRYVYRAA